MERNPEQKKRFDKLQTDEFFFLDATREPTREAEAGAGAGTKGKAKKAKAKKDEGVEKKEVLFRVNIVGSTKSIYEAMVHSDRTFFCSCPDGKTHAQRHGVVCKHICFLTQRVLRLDFAKDVYDTGYVVAEAKWAGVLAKLEQLAAGGEVDRSLTDDELTARWRKHKGLAPLAPLDTTEEVGGDTGGTGAGSGTGDTGGTGGTDPWLAILATLDKLTEDDVCAICFAEYVPEHPATAAMAAELQSCATCRGLVHAKCMAKWTSMGRSVCVNCNTRFVAVAVGPKGTRVGGSGGGEAKRRRVGADDMGYVNLGDVK